MSEAEEEPRSNTVAGVVTALLALGLVVGGVLMAFDEKRPNQLVNDGKLAPEATIERLDGTRVTLSSLRGKVVVLDFWATWCPPCVEEMPELVKVGQDYASQGVVLLALSEDDGDTKAIVREYMQARLPDLAPFAALSNLDAEAAYGVKALPTLFIIDRQGKLVASRQGQVSMDEVRGWLDAALR